MIDIYEFSHSQDGLRVEYSNLIDIYRITTRDEPRSELFQQQQNILRFALDYFGLQGLACNLKSIKWATGPEPGTRIELNVSTLSGDYARLVLPKIDNRVVVDEKTEEPVLCAKNWYLGALELFGNEVVEFIKGKKAQLALPFDTEASAEDQDTEAVSVEFKAAANQ
jgi:hypothetical protein